MVEVTQVLDEVVAPCEALVAHARAVLDRAWKIGRPHAMDCRLVPLEICETCEVGRRRAVGKLAFPGPDVMLALLIKHWD